MDKLERKSFYESGAKYESPEKLAFIEKMKKIKSKPPPFPHNSFRHYQQIQSKSNQPLLFQIPHKQKFKSYHSLFKLLEVHRS